MNESLPNFAKDWMAQWKRAAVELPKIRAAELRRLRPSDATDAISLLDLYPASPTNPHENGLVIQQKWFMRQRLLQLQSREANTDGIAKASSVGD